MKLLDNIASKLFQKQINELVTNTANNYNEVMFEFINNMPILPVDNQINYMKCGYQANEDVYSIVTKIATKCAMCPVILYEVKDETSLKRYKLLKTGQTKEAQFMASVMRVKALKEVEKHNILDILETPNPQQSGFEWTMASFIFQLVNGNMYIWGNEGMNKGLFWRLYTLPAHLTNIVGGSKFDPVKGYKVNWTNDNLDFEAKDVLHIKYPGFDYDNQGGQLYGQSPLKVALKNTLARNNKASEQATRQMENAGALGIVSNDQEKFALNAEQKKQLEDKLKEKLLSKRSYERWIVSNGKLDFTQMGFSMKDLEVISTLQWDQKKLCNIYGYPIQLLNSEAASTDNNMKWAAKNFINNTVAPLLSQFDDGLNKFLVQPYAKKDGKKYYIEHDISAYPEMQEDMSELVTWLDKAWWIDPNTKLEVMKFETSKDPAMDKVYIPSNFIPISEMASPDMPVNDTGDY